MQRPGNYQACEYTCVNLMLRRGLVLHSLAQTWYYVPDLCCFLSIDVDITLQADPRR